MKFEDMINRVICGDCLEVMKDIPDNSIDLVVTSPPYDNLREIDDYENLSFRRFKRIAKQILRIVNGIVVWVVRDATINGSETGTSFKQALFFKKIGFNLHDTMIYLKDGFRFPFPNRYHQVFEYMFVFSKGPLKTFNPIEDRRNKNLERSRKELKRETDGSMTYRKGYEPTKFGKRYNVWKYGVGAFKSTKDRIAHKHPAIFPDKLVWDHIISWSNENQIVLDPFLGSGTTAVVCKKLNRKFIGIEINPEYCKIAEERIKKVPKRLDKFV